jgi:putative transposase
MRAAGLRGCMRGKKRRTTRRDARAAPAPHLLRGDFVAGQPNRVWLADITYIHTYRPTREGFLYLAFTSWRPIREGSSGVADVARWLVPSRT